ncbi:E3 ubiquitin-protein ligase RBBP6 [Balamuthia mandrillaris]
MAAHLRRWSVSEAVRRKEELDFTQDKKVKKKKDKEKKEKKEKKKHKLKEKHSLTLPISFAHHQRGKSVDLTSKSKSPWFEEEKENDNANAKGTPTHKRRGSLSASTIIFGQLKTRPEQTEVTIDEVISVLSRLLKGLLTASQVESMVCKYCNSKGITSEVSCLNEREFKGLMNRLLDEWIEEMDTDKNGSISKTEFYNNLKEVHGWQTWLIKSHINKTFDNAVAAADVDGDQQLGKEEIKALLKKFAVGELEMSSVLCLPPLSKLFI